MDESVGDGHEHLTTIHNSVLGSKQFRGTFSNVVS